MSDKIKRFDTAHNEKLNHLPKEERAELGLKKLVEEMKAKKDKIKEPKGFASGLSDKDGKIILDLEEDD